MFLQANHGGVKGKLPNEVAPQPNSSQAISNHRRETEQEKEENGISLSQDTNADEDGVCCLNLMCDFYCTTYMNLPIGNKSLDASLILILL